MSEYPIPMEIPAFWEGVVNCIPAPRGGDTGSDRSATRLMSKMLSRLYYPHPQIRSKQTSSSKKAHESMANEKSPLNPYQNPELKCS
jgi:hypothetical protein